jgi:hypothetical protein
MAESNTNNTPKRPWLNWFATATIAILSAVLAAKFGIVTPPLPPTPQAQPQSPGNVQPCCPPCPGGEAPKPTPPAPRADAPNALTRIQFGNAGCTATIIGPRRDDGKWWVLTAAHCLTSVGQHGTMRLKDGRVTGVIVQSINVKADCAWLLTETNSEQYPFALLAPKSPPVGAKIWHAGYGVHIPGNREDGHVEAGPDQNGQLRFRLSVSSGDSGGGICLNESGEVVSTVCCTTARGQVAQVWGASVESIVGSQPTAMVLDGWTPIELPLRKEAGKGE